MNKNLSLLFQAKLCLNSFINSLINFAHLQFVPRSTIKLTPKTFPIFSAKQSSLTR